MRSFIFFVSVFVGTYDSCACASICYVARDALSISFVSR